MFHRFLLGVVTCLLIFASGLIQGQEPPVNDLLELISLECRVGDVEVPQNHDVFKYSPYLEASDGDMADDDVVVDDVVKVAVLGVFWEEYCIQRHRAIRARIGATEGFFLGGASVRPAGAAPEAEFDFDAHDAEFKARMVGPLQLAIKHGALASFENKNFVKRAQQGYDLGFKVGISNMMTATANEYRLTAEMAELQDAMWNAAGRVARTRAKPTPLDASQVAVKLRIERGRGFTIVVHNQSPHELHNLTLVANGKKTPVRVNSPNGDRLLGGLTSLLSGEDDPTKIGDAGNQLAQSTEDYYNVLNRPAHVFLHISSLPAGEEWSTVFIRSSMEMGRIESARFWLWTDEGSVESQPLGGLDEVREEMRKNAANNPGPPNRRDAQAGSSLVPPFGGSGGGNGHTAPTSSANPPTANKSPSRSTKSSFNDIQNSTGADRLLLQANNIANVNLVEASAQFRQIIARYPKSDEAAEAKEWLKGYPHRLIERAEKTSNNFPGHMQAILLYKEALGSKPDQADQKAAKKGLEDRAAKLLAAAIEMEDGGNKVGAARIYNQLIQDLPSSKEAAVSRSHLRKAATPKKQ